MKKIREKIESIRAVQKELADLRRMEDKVTTDLLSIANESISTPTVRQKVADASLTRQVITNRRAALAVPKREHFLELDRLVRAGAAQWNAAVMAAADNFQADLIQSSLAWFDDKTDCMAFWMQGNLQHIPVLNRLRNLSFDSVPLAKSDHESKLAMAEGFMAHVQRHAATIKFDPASIN